jgi:hypothetical protein
MEGNSITERLREVATQDSRELDRVCEDVARGLFEAGTEPPFELRSADFAADPFLICADRYWRLRFLQLPSVRTAAECARWLYAHTPGPDDGIEAAVRTEIEQKWALGYAFVTRDVEESPGELADACPDIVGSCDVAAFAAVYHAGKLRANFRFDRLHAFLESSMLAMAAGEHRRGVLFTALRAFAAHGSRRLTAEHAGDLLDHAWYSPHRTRHTVDLCLNALAVAAPFDGRGELLRDRAGEAAAEWPENHVFAFRMAAGLHECREHDEALAAVDLALTLLPATGTRVSHELFQEQYLTLRQRVLDGRQRAEEEAAHRAEWERQNAAYRKVEARLNSTTGHLLTMVTVFLAAIAFIISTMQLTYGGRLSLGDRLWLILAQGGVLLAFCGLIVLGTHLLLRYRQRPPGRRGPDGRSRP